MLRRSLVCSLAAALLACETHTTAPTAGGEVTAQVQGSEGSGEYVGSGEFGTNRHPIATSRPVIFSIRSVDRRAVPVQRLTLWRRGSEQPTTGTFSIGGTGDFAARYEVIHDDGARVGFSAHEGELEITVSTDERLEGTFRFAARQNCIGTSSMMSCTAGPLPSDVPSVEVGGRFSAVGR